MVFKRHSSPRGKCHRFARVGDIGVLHRCPMERSVGARDIPTPDLCGVFKARTEQSAKQPLFTRIHLTMKARFRAEGSGFVF